MNNQRNTTPLKETNKIPMTYPKKIKIYELSKKELRTTLLKKCSKLKENK